MANFVDESGKVRAVRDMNVRIGAPSLKARPIAVVKGTAFAVVGYVTDGDIVNGISRWYKTSDGNYLWAANTERVSDESLKILHAPLAKLICTQKFGERPEVYKDLGSPRGHNGLDFRTWVNNDPGKWEQLVFVVLDGTVGEAAYDPKFKGNYVRIRHENEYESVYLHLSKLSVKQDQTVHAGDEIGISGNSGGASEAPHLHFGYRPTRYNVSNGYMGYIDPTSLFIDKIKYV